LTPPTSKASGMVSITHTRYNDAKRALTNLFNVLDGKDIE